MGCIIHLNQSFSDEQQKLIVAQAFASLQGKEGFLVRHHLLLEYPGCESQRCPPPRIRPAPAALSFIPANAGTWTAATAQSLRFIRSLQLIALQYEVLWSVEFATLFCVQRRFRTPSAEIINQINAKPARNARIRPTVRWMGKV